MSAHDPVPQTLTHETPRIDLGRRPALVLEPAATTSGTVLALLGFGLLALGVAGFVRTVGRSPIPWELVVGGVVLAVFGASMAIVVTRTLLVTRRIRFDGDSVTISRRGPLGRSERTLPYASFRGIQVRRVLLPARYGGGRSVHHVELSHADPRNTIRLLNVSAGAMPEAELREYAESCARELGLPIVEP